MRDRFGQILTRLGGTKPAHGRLSREAIRAIRASGGPDLMSHEYSFPPAFYYEMYQDGYRDGWVDFQTRARATWGLIANGVDAIPYAVRMLQSSHAEEREDAGGIFGAIGEYVETAVPDIVSALEGEEDVTARDALIGALGAMRAKEAIPTLSRLIIDPETDGDTAFEAALSLGKIVRKRFDRDGDPIVAARNWIEQQR